MRIIRYFIGVISLSFVLVTSPALAADLFKGLAAYLVGDYETALHVWTPLAEDGNAEAQYNLGVMYANGRGVLQDYQRAHMWGNLARSNGREETDEFFDYLTPKMTTSDITRAQQMARECLDSGYKNC